MEDYKCYRMLFAITAIVATVVFILDPAIAHAWGPATHLEIASLSISELALLPPAVKLLLGRHHDHFLYGSVAADITVGKGLRGRLHNCHNWQVALNLFYNIAKKDRQKAFMLGYLGHLAADTVAHNLFVPFKIIRSWRTTLLKHVYWEMRMDESVPEKFFKLMEQFSGNHFGEDDKLLEESLKRTFFSFKTNKKIFNSLLVIQRMKHYKRIAQTVARKSVWKLSPHDIKNYKDLSRKALVDFLMRFENSFCLKADPTGKAKILLARRTVRHMRKLGRNRALSRKLEYRILDNARNFLEANLYSTEGYPRDFVNTKFGI